MKAHLPILAILVVSLVAMSASADYSAGQCDDSQVIISNDYPYTITYYYDKCTWTVGVYIVSTRLYSEDESRKIALDFLNRYVGQEIDNNSYEVCTKDNRCTTLGIYTVDWVRVTLDDLGKTEYIYHVGRDLKLIYAVNVKSTQVRYEESEFKVKHKPQSREFYTPTPTAQPTRYAYGDTVGCLFGEYRRDAYKYFDVEVMQGKYLNFYEVRLEAKQPIKSADMNLRDFATGFLKHVSSSRCDGGNVRLATISAVYNSVACKYVWDFNDNAMWWECEK